MVTAGADLRAHGALDRRTVTTIPAGRATCSLSDVDEVVEAPVFSPAGFVEQATDAKRRRSKKLWWKMKHQVVT
jgi:hypothetical protein